MEIATKQRFTFIDGLRGIAAISVMFRHFYTQLTNKEGSIHLVPEPLHSFFMAGNYGVQIFFVLSGFVIAFSVLKQGITLPYIGNFALRRSLRLDPPYWIVIVLSILALIFSKASTASGAQLFSFKEFFLNLFYLDNLTGAPTIVSVGWTLQIEVQFYLIFVFLLFFSQKLNQIFAKDANLWWLLFIPLFLYGILIQFKVVSNPNDGLFLPYWSMFFMGAVSYWVIDKRISYLWVVAVMLVVILCNIFVNLHVGSIIAMATALAILLASYTDKMYTWLSNPVIQYLGSRSYSIYLIHSLIGNRTIRFFLKKFPNSTLETPWLSILAMILATALSLLVSELLYRLVEKQSVKFSKKFAYKSK